MGYSLIEALRQFKRYGCRPIEFGHVVFSVPKYLVFADALPLEEQIN